MRSQGRLRAFLDGEEKKFIGDALRRHGGHVTKTARWLEINRRTLYLKLPALGLDGEAAGLRTESAIPGKRGARTK